MMLPSIRYLTAITLFLLTAVATAPVCSLFSGVRLIILDILKVSSSRLRRQIAPIGGKILHVEILTTWGRQKTMCANLRTGDGLKAMFGRLRIGDSLKTMYVNPRTGDGPKTMYVHPRTRGGPKTMYVHPGLEAMRPCISGIQHISQVHFLQQTCWFLFHKF